MYMYIDSVFIYDVFNSRKHQTTKYIVRLFCIYDASDAIFSTFCNAAYCFCILLFLRGEREIGIYVHVCSTSMLHTA